MLGRDPEMVRPPRRKGMAAPAPVLYLGSDDAPQWARGTGALAAQRSIVSLLQAVIAVSISLVATAQYHGAAQSGILLYTILAWLPVIVRGLMLGAVAGLVYASVFYPTMLLDAWRAPPASRLLTAHFVVAIVLFSAALLMPPLVGLGTTRLVLAAPYYIVSPVLWGAYLFTGWHTVLPGYRLLPGYVRHSLIAVVAGVVSGNVIWRAFERWGYPDARIFTQAAMGIAGWISNLLGHPIVLKVIKPDGTPVYREGAFSAFIFPSCSGLEGVGLTVLLLLAVVLLERRRVPLWKAIGLVVVAALIAFLLNALRLVALFYIGDVWSPEIAVNGFHTNFGVLSLVAVTGSFALAIRQLGDGDGQALPEPPFAARVVLERPSIRLTYPTIALIAGTLVFGLLAGQFNWFYPLPVALAGIVLWRLHLPPVEPDWTITILPLAAGFGAFALWTMMIPVDPVAGSRYAATLFAASPALATPWLMVRVIGSVLIVPIAEELTFRGFFIPWTSDALAGRLPHTVRRMIAVVTTSIGFGLMHAQIVAGIVAGLLFGVAYVRRRSCRDAILAHGTTNLLLCGYAIGWGHWCYFN